MCGTALDLNMLDPSVLVWTTGMVSAACAGVRLRSKHAWVTTELAPERPASTGYRGVDDEHAPRLRTRSHAVRGEERKLVVYLGLIAALLLAVVVTGLSEGSLGLLGPVLLTALGLIAACSLVSALALIAASPLYLRLLPWTRVGVGIVAVLGMLAGLTLSVLVLLLSVPVGATLLAFMLLLTWMCIENARRLRAAEHTLRDTLQTRGAQ